MSEQVPYGVISPEWYLEVCLSEYIGDVRRLLTHIGESDPFAFRSLCHLLPCFGTDGLFLRLFKS